MLDLSRCKFYDVIEVPILSTGSVTQEGMCLVSALESGEETVNHSGGGVEVFAGFSINCQKSPVEIVLVEEFTIPDTAVDADRYIQLSKTTIIKNAANNHKIAIDIAGTIQTEAAAIADGSYVCSDTGKVTFHTAQKGLAITVTYKYSPTALELQATVWEGGINMDSAVVFGKIGVIKPPCIIYTSEYNPKRDWANATSIKTAASGQLDDHNGAGTAITGARVIHVPDADNPYLGIEII